MKSENLSNKIKYPFLMIGIDLGGTKIAGGVVKYISENDRPEVIERTKVPTEAKLGAEKIVENVIKVCNLLIEKVDDSIPIEAIGIASAGRCNMVTKTVDTATDTFPGFTGIPICKLVSQATEIESFVLNDVQAHTLGESRWGAGRGKKNIVMLAVGTGIGGSVIVDGKLMRGHHGYAGELGHVQAVLAKDVDCTCGKSGHLEAIAAGSGMERVYYKRTGNNLSGPEISELAYKGDKDAIFCLKLAGRSLGQIIALYQSVFDPEIIILSGSVIKAGKIWEDALQAGINEEIISEIAKNLKISDALLVDDAPIIGACENALDGLKSAC